MRYIFLSLRFCLCLLLPLQAAYANGDGVLVPEPRDAAFSSSADDSANALIQNLLAIESLQGDFTQKQYSEAGDLLEQSSGRFMLLRPGFFRWDIQHPDNQLIVADPHYLWHHDVDLETVTRRPATASGQMAPLKILGGDHTALRDEYRITSSGENRYRLEPRGEGAGFTALTLALHAGNLSRMEVEDELGQTITIEFFNVDTSSALKPDDFAFVPPADADLFYYDE